MQILTINSGSSSIKFSVYDCAKGVESRLAVGMVNNIGMTGSESEFTVDSAGAASRKVYPGLPDHDAAIKVILDWLKGGPYAESIAGVGHRVVHGGERFIAPSLVNTGLLEELRRLRPLAPNHLPHEILAIESIARFAPDIRQVACFDTSFHRAMPMEAQTYPLPEDLRKGGIVRYGFHGLSYEYIMSVLAGEAGSGAKTGRVIIAHLGHGASMAAVKDGRCMDTSMGFTPSGGLVMSTRTGDLDPGIIIHLLTEKGMTIEEVNTLVYKRSGLLALSGASPNMRELLERSKTDPHAAMAVAIFCYQVRKFIGAYSAVLGGLDTLVFTAGIGENAAYVRFAACQGLEYLGVGIDPALNNKAAPVISKTGSNVTVRVIKTNEELMVARHTSETLGMGG
ncbi:MAG: acetate/propionate family kinase [Deltaproteobacteria bacterium]|nr:acetate/propionate family kinase [Deltaproteobacteria bacterium]